MMIAVIGAGAMGEALIAGWIASGIEPGEIAIVDASASRVADLEKRHGVRGVDLGAAARAETLVLAVKPHQVPGVIAQLVGQLSDEALIVSIAAGVPLSTLEAPLPGVAVVRVMPNTPALVGEGMSALSPGEHCDEAGLGTARELLECCGRVVVVPEKQQDAITAVSGSGPAYVFGFAEALIDSGVLLGLPRDVAAELAIQTLVGAASMLRDCGTPPSLLREQVTSPGGSTAAALREFDRHGLRSAIIAGVEAAHARSAELGE